MPNVKIIDASTWAALTEISLTEGEDLATKGLVNGTYRCIRSDVNSASITQWAGVGVESASEVGAASVFVTDLVAAGIESASEVGAPTVSEGGGGPTGPDDDFADSSIAGFWTPTLPAAENSDLSISEGAGGLTLSVGNTYVHDAYNAADPAVPRLMQSPDLSGDFVATTSWSSAPAAQNQGQGIMLFDGDGDWARFDVFYNGSTLQGFAAIWNGSGMENKISPTSAVSAAYIRVSRSGTDFTFEASADGSSWTEIGSGFADARTWTQIGIFGHRSNSAGAYDAVCAGFTLA